MHIPLKRVASLQLRRDGWHLRLLPCNEHEPPVLSSITLPSAQ